MHANLDDSSVAAWTTVLVLTCGTRMPVLLTAPEHQRGGVRQMVQRQCNSRYTWYQAH